MLLSTHFNDSIFYPIFLPLIHHVLPTRLLLFFSYITPCSAEKCERQRVVFPLQQLVILIVASRNLLKYWNCY